MSFINNIPDDFTITVGNNSGFGSGILDSISTASDWNSSIYITDDSLKIDDNKLVIGKHEKEKTKIFICEKWQSRNPIDLGDGLFASFPDDMLTDDELRKKVYNKIEELHPDKAIKLGLNEENIALIKKSVTIEIDIEGD